MSLPIQQRRRMVNPALQKCDRCGDPVATRYPHGPVKVCLPCLRQIEREAQAARHDEYQEGY